MKKTFLLFMGLILTLGAFAQHKHWSKWSVTLDAGLNKFDGDVTQSYNRVIPTAFDKLTIGGSLEYNLTPIWSTGLQYFYLPISAEGRVLNGVPGYTVDTKMHNIDYFLKVNFIRAFFERSTSKWGLFPSVGLGMAFYAVNYQTDGKSLPSNNGTKDQSSQFNDGRALYFPVGVLLEYNLTKSLALGTKLQHRFYSDDNLDGRDNRGVSNDNLALAVLQLRFKFNALKKDHLRNTATTEFNEDVTRSDIDKLQEQINGVVVPVVPVPDPRIDELDKRVKKLEDILCPDGPDTDGDGVPDCRDKEPNTPEGNQVDFWGRTIPKGTTYDPAAFIYFDFDKIDLDTEAHKAIRIAAEKLKADPELIVEVRGFTDNMGTNAYNANLSQRRANKVKNELIVSYGIEANRIVANGKGKFNPEDKTIPYRPYRTAAFFYNK